MTTGYWEQYIIEHLTEWTRSPEQPWCEFKENRLDPRRVGEYVSALANGACLSSVENGWLIVGVRESEQTIIGTSKRWHQMKIGNQDLELHLRSSLSDCDELDLLTVYYKEVNLLVLRVAAAKGKPVQYRGEAIVRINSQTTKLSEHPSLARQIYNSESDWSAALVSEADVDDLDEQAVDLARKRFQEEHPALSEEVATWPVITLLEKLKLARKGRISRAALLLLGKEESAVLLSPAVAEITWRLKSGKEEAYEHFGPPFLLSTSRVLARIRNYRQRIFPDTSLFPEEVMKYEPEVFLEALHNCIAHQDYRKNSRIILVEREDCLIFRNAGGFYCGLPNDYLEKEETPEQYRNKLLSMAMKSLRMVDTVGSGIRKMFRKQIQRCFPLPDYTIESDRVELCIHGRIIDEAYAKLLMEETDMPFEYAIGLDRVQKGKTVSETLLQDLRKRGYIEGNRGSYRIGRRVAMLTGQKIAYLQAKGVDRNLIKQHVLNALSEVDSLSRQEITSCIEGMLPVGYTTRQKYDYITNLLSSMANKDATICKYGSGRKTIRWKLNK